MNPLRIEFDGKDEKVPHFLNKATKGRWVCYRVVLVLATTLGLLWARNVSDTMKSCQAQH